MFANLSNTVIVRTSKEELAMCKELETKLKVSFLDNADNEKVLFQIVAYKVEDEVKRPPIHKSSFVIEYKENLHKISYPYLESFINYALNSTEIEDIVIKGLKGRKHLRYKQFLTKLDGDDRNIMYLYSRIILSQLSKVYDNLKDDYIFI